MNTQTIPNQDALDAARYNALIDFDWTDEVIAAIDCGNKAVIDHAVDQMLASKMTELPPTEQSNYLAGCCEGRTDLLKEHAVQSKPVYYMRDNHTFKLLSGDADTALAQIEKEFDAGFTHGSLCSKREGFEDVQASGSASKEEFFRACRERLSSLVIPQNGNFQDLAKVYASMYASPHHITFTTDGLKRFIKELTPNKVALKVIIRSYPESNGKRNWTALLTREQPWHGLAGNGGGITIARGELWNRVAYEAERTRVLLGERESEPPILEYGKDIQTPAEWVGNDPEASH